MFFRMSSVNFCDKIFYVIMMKIFNVKEAISKALRGDDVEMKMKGAIATMHRNGSMLHVDFTSPKIRDGEVKYEVIASFDCRVSLGISAIAQALDMNHKKARPAIMTSCVDSREYLLKQADELIWQAKEIEMLIKGR